MADEKKIDIVRASKSPFKAWDILVFATAVALTVVLLLSLYKKPGARVEISASGVKTVLPLNKDCERIVDGKLTLVIFGGECYVKCSTCEKKTCEKTGHIKYKNQSIICAENRIVVRVLGEDDGLAGTVGQG